MQDAFLCLMIGVNIRVERCFHFLMNGVNVSNRFSFLEDHEIMKAMCSIRSECDTLYDFLTFKLANDVHTFSHF